MTLPQSTLFSDDRSDNGSHESGEARWPTQGLVDQLSSIAASTTGVQALPGHTTDEVEV